MSSSPKIETHTLRCFDGTRLFARWFTPLLPASSPVATVVITHGLGEHSSRYGHVIQHLLTHGYEVVTYDIRGHGRSAGRRGDTPSFQAFLDDLGCVVGWVKQRRPTPRLFLYGHSMGGLITLSFTLEDREPLSGVIAASTWLRLTFQPPWWKLFIGRIMRHVYPGFRQFTGLDPMRLSHDIPFLTSMPDLELSHHQLSARLFYGALEACDRVMRSAHQIKTPLLLLHGQADPITSWIATQEFYELAGPTDKTLRLYPDFAHETHNERDRHVVLNDITDWLNHRCIDSLRSDDQKIA